MKLNKFWLALAWFLTVSWINEAQAQAKNNTIQDLCENFSPKKDNTITIRNKKDLPKEITDHEEFISTNVYELIMIYWKKRALDLINQHMLIEINKFREENGKAPLELSPKLQKLSQNRTEYLFKIKSCDHWEWDNSLENRIKKACINCVSWWENLCQWQYTIEIAMNDLKESPDHAATFLGDYRYFWAGMECTDTEKDNKRTGKIVIIWDKAYLVSETILEATWCTTLIK